MNLKEIQRLEQKVHANVFKRLPVAVKKGKGVYLTSVDGTRYLDYFSGIAVNSVGHCHPKVVSAIKKQASTLIHTSNWLYTIPQLKLAEKLTKLSGMQKCFFTNDGTETVEAAIKLARTATGKNEIIGMRNAFHGRTLGSLSLTWNKNYREPFKPLTPGTKFIEYNNIKALKKAISIKTAAVIIEPIQGEAGIIVPSDGYLREVRKLTSKKNVLLIVDEVATGFGRTGKMFAFQYENIKPDIICVAKALGSGFPIGALLYHGIDFKPGQHGGTFIGNPLACAAALASIDVIVKEKLVLNSMRQGKYLMDSLSNIGFNVHGKGLMIGVDVKNGRKTVLDLIKKKILTINSGNTVRLLPPLIVKKNHSDIVIKALNEVTK